VHPEVPHVLTLNTINGGNFKTDAFANIKTVMLPLRGPLVARGEAVSVYPTTLIPLGSKQKLVSSKFRCYTGTF
jgi:hypothetical protein